MTRTETVRSKVQKLLRAVPFQPFVLTLENREQLPVEHPENIAFRPDAEGRKGAARFYVVTDDDDEVHVPFAAVTSIAVRGRNEPLEEEGEGS